MPPKHKAGCRARIEGKERRDERLARDSSIKLQRQFARAPPEPAEAELSRLLALPATSMPRFAQIAGRWKT